MSPRPPLILAIDQGTTSTRAIVFDCDGRWLATAQAGVRATLSGRRLGGARSGGHLARPRWPPRAQALLPPSAKAARWRPSASPTSARPPCCGTARPARRSTTPSSGRTGAPPPTAASWRREGGRAGAQARSGLLLDPYFSATKARLDPGPRGRRPRRGAGRAAGLRHGGQLPAVAADRAGASTPPTPPTPAAPASTTSAPATGDEELLRLFDVPRRRAAAGAGLLGAFGHTAPELFGRAIPIWASWRATSRRRGWASAASTPGDVKTTFGTGGFMVVEHGRPSPCRPATAC